MKYYKYDSNLLSYIKPGNLGEFRKFQLGNFHVPQVLTSGEGSLHCCDWWICNFYLFAQALRIAAIL